MKRQLFTAITFFIDKKKEPIKHRNINNLSRYEKFIRREFPDASYSNFYDKETKKYNHRFYYKTLEEIIHLLNSNNNG